MDVLELAAVIIALTADIRKSVALSADEVAAVRKGAIEVAGAAGLSPEAADRLADEAQNVLGAFADALIAAREAAEAVAVMAENHEKELSNARTD